MSVLGEIVRWADGEVADNVFIVVPSVDGGGVLSIFLSMYSTYVSNWNLTMPIDCTI